MDYQSSEGDKDDEPQDVVAPPRFIEVQKGKISLGPPKQCDPAKEKERVSRLLFLFLMGDFIYDLK